MITSDLDLLQQYARENSEEAFAKLISRHLGLVYSAALRQVRSPQLAEEVAQSVFTDLSRNAVPLCGMKPDTILTAWLYQVTRRTAIDVIRRESRRQFRERIAVEMTDMNSNPSEWTQVEPLLDEAMEALDETDRSAILLRYFENKSLREVGQTIGTSEDAAQKRVSRAVERLREFFAKRGVTVGASGLVVVISANAVQSAPIALTAAISTSAALSGAAIKSITIGLTKTLAMTTIQKTLVTATIIAAVGTGIYEARQATQLREQTQALRQQQAPLAEQIQQLQRERDVATNRLAGLLAENSRLKLNPNQTELLKLRGEVTRLKADSQELELLNAALSVKTNDPTEIAMRSWIARTMDLHQRIEQMPDTKIPEFNYLTASDWLDISKDASLETEDDLRNAAQMLGANAKNQFARLTKDALSKFLEANNGELPTAMSQLKPFFTVSVDDDVLQRYELLQSGNIKNVPETERSFRLIAERRTAPVGSRAPIVQIGTEGFIRTGQ